MKIKQNMDAAEYLKQHYLAKSREVSAVWLQIQMEEAAYERLQKELKGIAVALRSLADSDPTIDR